MLILFVSAFKWCSGVTCNWCASLLIALILTLILAVFLVPLDGVNQYVTILLLLSVRKCFKVAALIINDLIDNRWPNMLWRECFSSEVDHDIHVQGCIYIMLFGS